MKMTRECVTNTFILLRFSYLPILCAYFLQTADGWVKKHKHIECHSVCIHRTGNVGCVDQVKHAMNWGMFAYHAIFVHASVLSVAAILESIAFTTKQYSIRPELVDK